MSVVALVCEPGEARTVITWAARFAVARKLELVIYYPTTVGAFRSPLVTREGVEHFSDPIRDSIQQVIETVVRTRKARKGRIGRYEISIRHITDSDPASAVIKRVRIEAPGMFVSAAGADSEKLSLGRQVATRIPCDSVLLYGNELDSGETSQISVVTRNGPCDSGAVQLAVDSCRSIEGNVTVYSVKKETEPDAGGEAEAALARTLDELGLQTSDQLKQRAIVAAEPLQTIADKTRKDDLILIGPDSEAAVTGLLELVRRPVVGVYRSAPSLVSQQGWTHALSLLPRINPADYADLYSRLQTGSRWNMDFIVMLGLATAIATLGLLQNSPAVVIGSMLLAPLMTPMIGMGLALNRGNSRLAYSSFRAIGRGFLACLVISAVIGFITPGSELTSEILARTSPNILDLLIAIFSGMAAAYAMARPGVAGGIAGVAIATALVPPICSAGIAISYWQLDAAIGAAWLLAANVLAIILAAAITFRAMGLSEIAAIAPKSLWVRRVVIGLTAGCIVIALPLFGTFIQQIRQGKPAPMALTVTNETRIALLDKIDKDPGVSLLLIGRPGIPRDVDPVDVGVIISSERPLPESYADEIALVVRESMQDESLIVRVECVRSGWSESRVPD